MEQKNQRNPKRRLNSLILLVAFTAVMLIVSTYAWFSSQKNVSMQGLTGEVNVAEGLQISLDAKNWSGSLDLANLKLDGTTDSNAYYNVVVDEDNGTTVSHTNFVPTELLPVSTTGTQRTVTEIPFYRGANTQDNTSKLQRLDSIAQTKFTYDDDGSSGTPEVATTAAANPDIYPGYYAFDIFLQNSGITSSDTQALTTMDASALASASTDVLQLNTDSSVTVIADGNPDVGLQGSVRVAFAEFSGFAEVTANQAEILKYTNAASSTISDVAIWEPNSTAHIDSIVTGQSSTPNGTVFPYKIQWDTGIPATYDVDSDGIIENGEYIPTYVLTDSANGSTISNIYDWKTTPTVSTDAGKLAMQNVIETGTTGHSGKVMDLKSTTDGTTDFKIYKNTVVKLRVYVWLEGQDIDCLNIASHGGGIDLDIGLIKSITTDIGNRAS